MNPAFLSALRWIALPLGPMAFLISKLCLELASFSVPMSVVMATLIWMLVWWVFTELPLAIAALIPYLVFPFFGVVPATDLAATAGSSIIFLFLGGFMLSAALEKWQVHRDFAHFLLKFSTGSIESLVLIFIFIAAFASMWISNTATILILLPVIEAIFPLPKSSTGAEPKRSWLGYLMLAAAYASSVGGIATIIGTPPNAIAAGFLRDRGIESLTFASWIKMSLPLAIVGCAVLYFIFVAILRHATKGSDLSHTIKEAISEIQKLPTQNSNRFEKWSIVGILFLCISGWLAVPYLNSNGIAISDSMIALGGGLLLFIWPTKLTNDKSRPRLILEARDLDRLPWATLFLFAGGLALSKGLQGSGWIEWSESYLSSVSSVAPWVLIGALAVVAVSLTEVMSNTALAALMVPWALSFDSNINVPLISIVMALCFASSMSFMMPVATPPNAIAFGRGHIKLSQMLKVGALLNIIFIVVISAYVVWVLPWLAPEI
jgi:solute carrier family 13 (sodium-dependent dicarboxylate transporter), member 2/3/5